MVLIIYFRYSQVKFIMSGESLVIVYLELMYNDPKLSDIGLGKQCIPRVEQSVNHGLTIFTVCNEVCIFLKEALP